MKIRSIGSVLRLMIEGHVMVVRDDEPKLTACFPSFDQHVACNTKSAIYQTAMGDGVIKLIELGITAADDQVFVFVVIIIGWYQKGIYKSHSAPQHHAPMRHGKSDFKNSSHEEQAYQPVQWELRT